MDPRLKILVAMVGAVLVGAVAYGGYFLWATCIKCQFGDFSGWPEHVTDINNIAFRYPPGFEIIVPEDETVNPVSIVKAGERGESVLMQVGTWRPGKEFENIEQVGDRYELAVQRRKTLSRENFDADGNDGVLLVQDETGSNRRIIEAFVIDTLGQGGPRPSEASGEGGPTSSPREISLQLPGTASAVERALYEKTFRALVASLDFLTTGTKPENGIASPELSAKAGRPQGIPESWIEYRNEEVGFSLWYASDWAVERSDLPGRSDLETSGTGVVFTSRDRAVTYSVLAFPKDQSVSLDDLNALPVVQTFRESAIGDETPQASSFGLADGSRGLSYEARLPKDGPVDRLLFEQTTKLAYLVLLVSAGDCPPEGDCSPSGRGYVIEASFTGGTQEERIDSAHARRMTRTLRLFAEDTRNKIQDTNNDQ